MNRRTRRVGVLFGGLLVAALAPLARSQDADNDGLPDAVETELGADPGQAERLTPLASFPAGAKEHPELDVVRVEMANVARDRWLWAVHFAKPYRFDNASLILYLDADDDPATGRKEMGCEIMLSHDRGRPGVTAFAPDGSPVSGPLPRVALVQGVLYFCHDGAIKQAGGQSRFRFSVLSETREPHRGVDGTGWKRVAGPPNSGRPKAVMLDDLTADEGFERTEGLDLVWKAQDDPANAVLSSVGAELKNMAYYDAEYRWPAVRGAGGTITATVPKAGRFFPAVVVYDTSGRETYELSLDGKRLGRFLAAEDDNRQRIHFLARPVDFRGGEKLTVRTGSVGTHITEDLLLLAEKPPVRKRKFELNQVEPALVVRDGQPAVRLTWITTWPAACTVEYGPTTGYGRKSSEEQPVANHRVFLPGLKEGETMHLRIVALRPDGGRVVSSDTAFTAAFFRAPGTARRERVPLVVENPYDFPLASYPVTNGVPFAKGELGDAAHVRLVDPQDREVPVQPEVAVRWQDGSVKWLRVSFLATAAARSAATYALEYGALVRRGPDDPAAAPRLLGGYAPLPAAGAGRGPGGSLTIRTGPIEAEFDAARSGFPKWIRFDADGNGRFDAGDPTWDMIVAEVADEDRGYSSAAPAGSLEIEEAGPVRVVVKTKGSCVGPSKTRRFSYTNRFTFYAGSPMVRLEHIWCNDQDAAFTSFDRMTLRVPLPVATRQWATGLDGRNVLSGSGELTLRQLRDAGCEVTPTGKIAAAPPVQAAGPAKSRADGWVRVADDRAGLTVAVRDFWQLYPKGFRVDRDALSVDLCPDFPPGTYDGCGKLDEIKLYYYLMGGKYKVARGVRKQHDLVLCFHRAGAAQAAEGLARAFQEPPIAACPPPRYCDTRVFGEILPATAGRSAAYEAVCEKVYGNYVRQREGGREYGLLNFGDQWGERRVNWANGEYDHHHAFLLQFARTADRKWYFLGEKAARHAIDVDTCHYGPSRGGEWVHSMGHTGGYFREAYEGQGIPGPGMSVSHTWTEGFYDWYVLSGDPAGAENAALVADHYGGVYLNHYDWGNCRTNGWHLLLTIAAYRATNDPFYLNAARIIVERTLERQSPSGGWHRQMVPGHCHDMPRHRGEANFMLGVLANGLEEYYREVPDPRVADAVLGGARQAVRELWVPASDGFRYTSCPNMTGYTANNDMTAEVLFFAHRLGGDPQYADIAMRAMRAAFRDGIGSIAHLRWTPHIIYNMDRLDNGRPARGRKEEPGPAGNQRRAFDHWPRGLGRRPAEGGNARLLHRPDRRGEGLDPAAFGRGGRGRARRGQAAVTQPRREPLSRVW